jgi:hypothetical protein
LMVWIEQLARHGSYTYHIRISYVVQSSSAFDQLALSQHFLLKLIVVAQVCAVLKQFTYGGILSSDR